MCILDDNNFVTLKFIGFIVYCLQTPSEHPLAISTYKNSIPYKSHQLKKLSFFFQKARPINGMLTVFADTKSGAF